MIIYIIFIKYSQNICVDNLANYTISKYTVQIQRKNKIKIKYCSLKV